MKESTDSINQTVRNQSDKQIKASIDARNIAYNAGTQASLNGLRQQVDGFQIRMDNQTRNVSDIVRENEAINADFKGIAKNLQNNTISNNYLAGTIKKMLIDGLEISTSEVTQSVVDDLEKMTGHAIDVWIKTGIHDELQRKLKKAERAKDIASWQEKQCEKYTKKNEQLVYKVTRCLSHVLFEFMVGLLAAAVVPGWWKAPAIITVAVVSWLFNKEVDDL